MCGFGVIRWERFLRLGNLNGYFGCVFFEYNNVFKLVILHNFNKKEIDMTHKIFIKRGGKSYGPYIYESYRENGKIKKRYLGIGEKEKSYTTHHGFVFPIIFIAILLFFAISVYFYSSISGKVSLDISSSYTTNEIITGNLNLVLKQGELIPTNSEIQANLGSQSKNLLLSDLLDSGISSGNYYAEGKQISGSGGGYGVSGEKSNSVLKFSYRIVGEEIQSENNNEVVNNSNNDEGVSGGDSGTSEGGNGEEQVQPFVETPTAPNQEETSTETLNSNNNYAESNSGESSSSGEVSGGLTGNVILEDNLHGSVSKDKDATISVASGETVEIISVEDENGNKLSNSLLNINKNENNVVVSTDYYVGGFGQEYLGPETQELKIDLAKLNLIAENGNLEIQLVYNNEELASVSKEISVEIGNNETSIIPEQNLTANSTIETNITANITIETNVTLGNLSIRTIQGRARLGEKVKWKKVVESEVATNITIEVPGIAENVSVLKVENNVRSEVDESQVSITGNVALKLETEQEGFLTKLWKKFRSITGFAVSEEVENGDENKTVIVDENATNFEVEYETPAPYSEEQNLTSGKEITIVGPDSVHYSDIVAYTELNTEVSADKIKLYWIVNGTKEIVHTDNYDLNENGLVDYIEWLVPHLSNQTYQLIIEISKAELLDENKTFIEDVYEQVKSRDYNYTSVESGQYLRVTFEQMLDNTRDITIYGKGNNSIVEIYKADDTNKIDEFVISEDGVYKKLLTSMTGEADVFDLKFLNETWVDYVVDPDDITAPIINFTNPTPVSGTTTTNISVIINTSITQGTNQIASIIYNFNNTNCSIYDSSLVLMYNFENNSALGENDTKVVDVSRYGNNGTNYGASWNSSGKYGGGYSFDGNSSYMFLGNLSNLNLSAPISISTWISYWGGGDTSRQMFVDNFNGDRRMGLGIEKLFSNNTITFFTSSTSDFLYSGITPIVGQWYYVVGVYNGTDNILYVNGVLTNSTHNFTSQNGGNWYIGEAGTANIRYFNGTIDEVRIWNRSLSTSEVSQQYISNLQKFNLTQWYLYVNQSKNSTAGLDIGTYSYQASATDTAGNVNSTETRTVQILSSIISDITPPLINFTSPTPNNNTITTNSSFIVNISIAEPNLNNVSYNFNNTNYSIYDSSLVLMYNFENLSSLGENDTLVADLSKYGNNGTNYGATYTSSGKLGGAYTFDGASSYINTTANVSAVFTYSAWINSSGSTYRTIIGVSSLNWDPLFYVKDDNRIGLSKQNINTLGTSSGTVTNGVWNYVAVTYNSSGDYAFYINGALSGSGTNLVTFTLLNHVVVGFTNDGGAMYFNGSIDEVRIWNRSLSASEIQQLYMSNLQKFNSTQWYLYVNQSKNSTNGLDNGAYTYQAFAQDSAGNMNQTEIRTIQVNLPDTTPPLINFTSPTPNNNTITTNTSFIVNISIEESSLGNLTYNFNNTNYNYYDPSLILMYNFDNNSAIGENDSYVVDSGIYGKYNGTNVGEAKWESNGRYGGMMTFNRTSRITYGSNGDNPLDYATNIYYNTNTVSIWMKFGPSEYYNTTNLFGIGNQGCNRFYINNLWDRIHCTVGNIDQGINDNSTYVTRDATQYDRWYNIIVTYDKNAIDGNTTHCYLDGVLGTAYYSNVSCYHPAMGIGYANFSVDELKIWNKTLSSDEAYQQYISNLYKFNSTQWYLYVNQSVSSSGNYTYQASASDTSGNTNSTDLRTIQVNLTDTTSPLINFTTHTPVNGTTQSANNIFVNVSSSDDNIHSVVMDWNRSLVGWYRFNSNTGLNDSSSWSNNGTNYGATYTSSGHLGGAYTFDGVNDYIDLASNQSLNISGNQLTIVSWFKTDSPQNDMKIFYGTTNNLQGYGVAIYNHTYESMFCTPSSCQGTRLLGTRVEMNDSRWHFGASVYNGSIEIDYIDGVQYGNTVSQNGNVISGNVNLIGSYLASHYFFNGSIDDFQIYSRALSAQEILAVYNATANQYYNNFTNLVTGNYTYQAYAQDSAGNVNQTEMRTIQVNLPDTTSPLINFTNPTPNNATTQFANSIYVNVSSSDGGSNHSTFVNFDNSLVSWWRMDDYSGNTVIDYIGRNNGTAINSTYTSSGKMSGAESFDGDGDYINISSVNAFPSGSLSFGGWVKFSGYTSDLQTIVYLKGGASNCQINLGRNVTGLGNLSYYLRDSNLAVVDDYVSNISITDGAWYHFFTTLEKSGNICNSSFYINSNSVRSATNKTCTGNFLANYYRFIGSADFYTFFNGSIDDIMIFNRSLSASEISALYNAQASQYYNNFTSLGDGVHTFTAYSQDLAGNVNSTELRSIQVNLTDITPPYIGFISPTNTTYTTSSIVVNISSDSTNLSIWWNNGTSNLSYSGVVSLTLADGNYNFIAYANDSLNNVNSTSISFVVSDLTAPAISTIADSVTSSTAKITWTSDEDSNSTVYYRTSTGTISSLSNTTFTTSHYVTLSGLSASTLYYYNVSSCDVSNNCNVSSQYSFITSSGGTNPPSAGGGGGGGGSSATTATGKTTIDNDFTIDKTELNLEKVSLKELRKIRLKIMNNATTNLTFKFASNKEYINAPDDVSIGANEEKEVIFYIYAPDKLGKYEAEISISNGILVKKIPVTIDVVSSALFDLSVSIPDDYKKVEQGKIVYASIKAINMGLNGKVDIKLDYSLRKGKSIIKTFHETLAVETQLEILRKIDITSDLSDGYYDFYAELQYEDSFVTASDNFYVGKDYPATKFLKIVYIIVFCLLVLGIIVYLLFKKREFPFNTKKWK